MNRIITLLIFFFLNFSVYGDELMNNIFFEPNTFNDLKYNWNNYIWDEKENACCNQISEVNKISINLPTKIYLKDCISEKIPIPICLSYYITEKRIYKYSKEEYGLTLHIKSIEEDQSEWFNYPIEKKEFIDYSMQEMIALSPDFEEEEKKRDILKEKYISLTDDELNDGYVYGGNITFNISDYISLKPIQGKYEIYVSQNNLESKHVILEIIFSD